MAVTIYRYDTPAARLMFGAVRTTRSWADYGRRVVGSAASPCQRRLTTKSFGLNRICSSCSAG
jgi:hypothetical protein